MTASPAPSAAPHTTRAEKDRDLDVMTYGEAMALFIADTAGPLSEVDRFTRRIAGADLNVATGLARLEFRVGYLSRVGDDSLGRAIAAAVAREGIDASHIATDSQHPTGFQLKARAANGADPLVESFRRGTAASHLSVQDFDAAYADRFAHLHLTGVAPALSATSRTLAFKLAAHFRDSRRTISFDPNLRPGLWPSQADMVDTLNTLADYATWVFPGIAEGQLLSGASTPEAIADFYLSRGAEGVFIKLGEAGAYFAGRHGNRGTIDAVPVAEVVDTVGAGDAFAVGVISALLEHASLRDAAQRGALLGALAVKVLGDSDGLPTRATLRMLEQRP